MKFKHLLKSLALMVAFLLVGNVGWAQTPYPMSNGNYYEDFSDIANWTNGFASGTGANRWGSVVVNATGTIPDGVRISTATSSFVTGSSGGVQKGSAQTTPTTSIVLLSTGSTDNATSCAIDLFLDFTGLNAGTISFDWASVNNSTGNRNGSLRVYTSTDGTSYTELIGAQVLNFTNNTPTSGSITNVVLPATFNNSPSARIRFYYHNGTGGTTGSRPKVSIDNIVVTTPDITPPTWTATYPNTSNLASTSVDLTVNANEPGTAFYVVLPNAAAAPSSAQVVAGTDAADAPVTLKGNINIAAATTNYTANITGLTASTDYDIYVVSRDDEGTPNLQASATLVEITTPAPDVTAPSWTATYPKTANVANNDFDLTVNIDEIGKVYYVVLANGSTSPTSAQVKAGQDGTGAAAFKSGSINITTASTDFTNNISGLASGTTYDVYVVAEDAIPNLQASPASIADVTTTSIKPVPTNHVTGLGATATGTSITLTWTDAVAGAQAPDNYLVVINTDNDFTAVVDGTAFGDDTDFADNKGALNIAPGVQTATFNGLTAGTTYHVSVFSYTNSGASINYKTDETVPYISKGTPSLTVTAPNLATERYYAGANVSITWTSSNMGSEDVKIEVYARTGSATWAWGEVVASTTNDGSYDYTIPAAALYGTQYKIRVTGLTSATTDESDAAFKVIAVANDIAALKANFDTDTVKLASEAVISFIRTANRNQKYIQDGTGGMLIDDSAGKLTGTWNIGDGITGLEGGLTTFTGLREFVPKSYSSAASSTGNIITPTVIDYATFAANKDLYESRLIRINNLTFSSSGTFATATNYNTTDGTNTLQFRTFKTGETNIIGTTIPSVTLDIIALAGENNGTLQIYSRTTADFLSKVATVSSTVYTVDGGAGTITNIPYAHSLATFEGNITPATGATFETYQADGTTVAADLQTGYKLIVTAQDGTTTKTYTITRNAASTDATVTSGSYTVNSTDNTITNVPYNESLASFETNITPAAGASFETYLADGTTVASDLATGYKLICTAEDGTSKKTYTITKNSEPSHVANIVTFSVASVDGTVNVGDHTVAVTVPYGTAVNNLVATFTLSTNAIAKVATVAQTSGVTANDFSSPVTYDITAEDGTTTVSWTVTVTVTPASTDATASSTAYTVDNGLETITNIPYNETLATFKGNITPATFATFEVYQSNGTDVATDLASGYKLIVTAQDGTTKKTYTITLNAAPPAELFISEYLEGSSNNKAIEIYNPTGSAVDLSQYSLKKGSNGADFSTNLALTGTLEPGKTFVIAHTSAIASIKNVANLIDAAGTIVYFNGNDAVGLFKNDVLIDVIGLTTGDPGTNWPVAGGAGATSEYTLVRKDAIVSGTTDWSASSGTNVDNSQWIVYAQNNVDYIGWHKLKSSENDIVTFTLAQETGAATIDNGAHTIAIEVANGTSVTALVPTITLSSRATVSPLSGVAQDFTNPVNYTVTAQDGTVQIWTVTVTVAMSTDATVSTTASYIIDNGAGTITNIPYAHSLATFEGNITPAAGATFETYQADGTTVATDLQTGYKLIVTAQDGTTTKTYTITRIAASTVSSLSSLKYDATSVPSFDAATLTYNVEFPFGTTAIPVVTATATDANANVAITQATSITAAEAERTATVVVTAEDGIAQTTYTIVFSVAPANTDNTLSDLKVAGTTIDGFVSTLTNYTYELPTGTTATPVVTATTNHATATAVVTDATDVTSATAADRTTSIEVTAQDGSKKTYTIEFNVAAPGTDATLTEIKVDGTALVGFNPLTLTYNISLAANTTVVPTVSVTTNDPLATTQITAATNLTGTLAERTTTILVTAENTTTTKTYSVIFYVKSGDATLSDLKYNTTQVPSFNPATLSYNVELPYGSAIPTINATKNFAGATVNVVNATNLKGTLAERTATITVTAEDVNISKVYTIVFTVAKSTDATLSDLQYNGTTVTGFDANIIKYFVTLPFGSSIPNVTATKNNADATIAITQVTDLGGDLAARTATVLVTAESGATKTYSIVFRVDNTEKELFFSEYVEGSSSNKAIEIYNPNSTAVDLSAYTVKISTNGLGFGKNSGGDSPSCVLPLTGTLAAGDVYVIYNASAAQAIKDKGDLISPTYPAAGSNVTSFNGNDALGLFKGTTLIDVFGGELVTTNFDVAGITGAAVDHTIVRKPTSTKGNTNWTSSAGTTTENSEWIVYDKDVFTYLGSHNMFAPVPAITTDKTSLPDFGSIVSGTIGAGEQSFIVGGVYLSSDIVITAPAGFEISTQSGANFVSSSPITLTPVNGIVAPDTIYVKFHPTAIQAYSANITIENGDVPTKDVAVSGTGVATDVIAPSFISGYPTLESVTPYTLDVKVKIDEVGFVYFHKVAKDATAPTADEIKAQGTVIDAVAANTEYTVNVTGLTDNTAYDFYFVAVDKQASPNTSSVVMKQVTTASIPVVTIHDIQYTTDASGDSPKKGQWVTTSGVVSAIKNGTNGQEGFYIQDAAGAWNGIYVYSTIPVAVTDRVSVTGTVIEYVDAKTELSSVTKVNITEQSVPVYTPVDVTTLAAKDEQYESVLVKVSNATCASGSNGSFIVNDNSGDLTVYKGLFIDLALVATKKYDIVGILDDYKPLSGTRMYELYPRNLGDITEVVTGIDDNFNSNLTVYPNPFTNEIRFNGVENVKRVVITSVTGQIIKNEVVDVNNFINTADLNRGMYIVTFINDKGEKAIKKMIKQ